MISPMAGKNRYIFILIDKSQIKTELAGTYSSHRIAYQMTKVQL